MAQSDAVSDPFIFNAGTNRFVAALALLILAMITAGCNSDASIASPTPAHSALNPATWPDGDLTIANLGHATHLMNYFGVRVISDPTLFYRVGVAFDSIFTIGPRRHVAPPLTA